MTVRPSDPGTRCGCCRGTWHQVTGFFFRDTPICGPCARDFVQWVIRYSNQRYGKKRFADYAFPPKE